MPDETRRLRFYSNRELTDLAREKWIENLEVYGKIPHEVALERWYALPARTKGYIETVVIAVYHHLWNKAGEQEKP